MTERDTDRERLHVCERGVCPALTHARIPLPALANLLTSPPCPYPSTPHTNQQIQSVTFDCAHCKNTAGPFAQVCRHPSVTTIDRSIDVIAPPYPPTHTHNSTPPHKHTHSHTPTPPLHHSITGRGRRHPPGSVRGLRAPGDLPPEPGLDRVPQLPEDHAAGVPRHRPRRPRAPVRRWTPLSLFLSVTWMCACPAPMGDVRTIDER